MSAPASRIENPFRALYDRGYTRLVSIAPPGAKCSPTSSLAKRPEALGKVPAIRGEDNLWRGYDFVRYDPTEADLETWFASGAGCGIKTGKQPDGTYLIGIDADTLDDRLAAIVAGHVRREFGLVPSRIGNKPKVLYVVRFDGPVRYSRVEFGPEAERVELLSDGRQFVATGIHPHTREPYRWSEKLVPFDQLKIFPAEVL
jgi:hypothetical protein